MADGEFPEGESKIVNIDNTPLHVVGIGASAGGLEAIGVFFDNLPINLGMAFVVVQHLSPDYKSLMKEILSKHTAMPVLRIEDGMIVERNHVYLIPPKQHLKIFHNTLLLTEMEPVRGINLPIDVFFRSLAEDQGEKAIGIILSGTGSDGSRGMRAIKEAGGMAMVQTRESAKFDGMPRAALASGLADFVLSPEKMPVQLSAYAKHPYATKSQRNEEFLDDQDGLTRIFALLREHSKVDFTFYKPSTVIRRIERRMTVNQVDALADYLERLQRFPGELTLLFRELLIGVTSFFRDPEAFRLLTEDYLPQLLSESDDSDLRFWVAGCSTGEEAYTLTMVTLECMERMGIKRNLKVFATDVDREAILIAGNGEYPESVAADIPSPYLSKYFRRRDESLKVARSIREMVVFAQHDLTRDPPFTNIDLVSCRNLLIYIQPVLQKQILEFFNFSLNPKGILMLGPSETTGEMSDFFESVNHRFKIYRSRGRGRRLSEAVLARRTHTAKRLRTPRFGTGEDVARAKRGDRVLESFLQALSPDVFEVALIVDTSKAVLHVIGDSSSLFQLPPGKMSNDVTKMAHKDLQIALAIGLQRVFDKGEALIFSKVRVRLDAGVASLKLRFRRLDGPPDQQALVAILIGREDDQEGVSEADEGYDLGREAEQRILDLEQDLQFNRENLQATIEELETANEELQATNEELLASNEELQSTNEELQSVNEELHTVNTEYHSKIIELTELNNDMENLLASTQIATIFVDEDLEVRKFTPEIASIVDIGDGDLGRPIGDLDHRLVDLDFAVVVAEVQRESESQEHEVKSEEGRSFLMRCLPYEIGPDSFSGVVATFIDISERVAAENALLRSESFLRNASRLATVGAWEYLPEENRQNWSEEVFRIHDLPVGTPPSAEEGITFYDEDSRPLITEAFKRLLEEGEPYDLVLRIVTATGCPKWVRAIGEAETSNGQVLRVAGAFQDISDLREKEVALRASERNYRDLFNSMATGFAVHRMVTDAEGMPIDYEFLEVNPAFEELTGLKARNVVGKLASDVIPGIRESDARWIERYGAVVDTGRADYFEAHEASLGRYYSVVAYRSEPDQFVTLFADVTQRKENELRLAESQAQLEVQQRLAGVFLTADADALFSEILAVILDVTASSFGYMGFIDANGDLVCPTLTRDVWDRCQVANKTIIFPRDQWSGLWGRSLVEGRTLWSNEGLRFPEGHLELECALVVPIQFEGSLIGQFAVANASGGYDNDDARKLEGLATYIAPFLNRKLGEELEKRE